MVFSFIKKLFQEEHGAGYPGPVPLPGPRASLAVSLVVPIPCESGNLADSEAALGYLEGYRGLLQELHPGKFEVLLAPHGLRRSIPAGILTRLTTVLKDKEPFRWMAPQKGPGTAVREAVLSSRGRIILAANLEYAYSPDFFRQALSFLKGGTHALVRANRRLPESEFIVPVTLLSLVYRRHLWGSLLGRFWSWRFKFPMTDTLSGGFALEREWALRIFNRSVCPDFLQGAELSILAQVNGLPILDLPVHFQMSREKSKARVLAETWEVLRWTWKFGSGLRRGTYRFLDPPGPFLAADDWGLSPAINEGILELARSGMVRQVSALAGGRFLTHRLEEMRKLQGIQWGLHFNMTQKECGGAFSGPGAFLLAWTFRGWNKDKGIPRRVREEVRTQIEGLQKHGIHPAHFDGHHHVHAVPGLLSTVRDILHQKGIRQVRVPYHPSLWAGPRAPIALLGFSAGREAKKNGFTFLPFYYPSGRDLKDIGSLAAAIRKNRHGEILAHPAVRDDLSQYAPSDLYRSGRVREFRVLRSLSLEASPNPLKVPSKARTPPRTT